MNKRIMKMSFKNLGLALGVVALTSVAFGQSSKVTSAAVEYGNTFQPAFMKQEWDAAKKSIDKARTFIDEAAAHEDTKNDQKMFLYQGQIYGALVMMSAMDENPNEEEIMGYLNTSIEAFDKGYDGPKKKYKSSIEDAVGQTVYLYEMAASMAYKQETYPDAAEAYHYAARYRETIDVFDTTLTYNAALCYDLSDQFAKSAPLYEKLMAVKFRGHTSSILASQAYRKSGDNEKAKAIINEARKSDPANREMLLELVNINLDAGDAEGAQTALSDVIKTDPNNKKLHYTIGTINIDLKENEKAEEALNRALEIDPDYTDAQYQLGAHLVGWAGDLNTEAKKLPFGDSNYNKLLAQSEDTYKRALVPLEKYILKFPEDKQILTILFQIHRNLGDSEKALEYKKRADAVK